MTKIWVVVNNGEVIGAYTNEAKAKELTRVENMAAEMGGGYPKTHYEAVNVDEEEED